jgi:hypothetical protein
MPVDFGHNVGGGGGETPAPGRLARKSADHANGDFVVLP